ncbi:(2Fe-2S) ferredoxin domain-containing protein [Hymenobacter weizhouensis]|uniref:(2Fe-2S) ferredoxin domain-containing protein n=1 Tax=Hymenobacter sp. YIM 151500-1 TaxID=2987689 RepID=UPI002227277D|nr:(2Fe-2S) ferredoxin domain-containing protein [Hymenobacter sp. YIM 151500-1]UYZ61613.1 (2Fe-2S) ferredoxin domain-containing protein [Hymenobacter sp. YIM 151500-1]
MKPVAAITRIFVCNAQKSEVGRDVAKALKLELKKQGLKQVLLSGEKHKTRVQTCNCLDLCKHCKKGSGAALIIYPGGTVYGDVKPKDAPDIVREHLAEGRPVEHLRLE